MLFNHGHDGIVFINQEHRVIDANSKFCEMLGYTKEEVMNLHTWDYDADMDEQDIKLNFSDVSKLKGCFESRHIRKDGSIIDVEISVSGANMHGRNIVACICVDISERKAIENKLKENEELLKSIFSSIQDGICVIDAHYTIKHVNKYMKQVFPDIESFVGRKCFEVIKCQEKKIKECPLAKVTVLREKSSKEIKFAGAVNKWYEINYYPMVDDEKGTLLGIISYFHDITERKEAETKLQKISYTDRLTSAYNRHYFELSIDEFKRKKITSIGVLSIDLDGLKMVNDNLGHPAGDELLKIAAYNLSRTLRKTDVLARIGGDEFYVLMPEVNEKMLKEVIHRILANAGEYNKKNIFPKLKFSIGGSIADNGDLIWDALRIADRNMYEMKRVSS